MNVFSITTAMPSNPPRIVCPTGAFHPICCSNIAIAHTVIAGTASIRSITSRVKSRRCSTQHVGHATGSTFAVNGDVVISKHARPHAARNRAITAPSEWSDGICASTRRTVLGSSGSTPGECREIMECMDGMIAQRPEDHRHTLLHRFDQEAVYLFCGPPLHTVLAIA